MRLAILCQDPRRARKSANELAAAGLGADSFESFLDATEAIIENPYDLVLTDCHLTDGNAVDWIRDRRNRSRLERTFVVVLADREEERVAALEAGADDSAGSVVSGRELVARVRAVLRRPRERTASLVCFGNLSICTEARVVSVAGKELLLQRRETAILEVLLRRAGNVVPRGALEHDVYGANIDCTPNSLEVRISRLRRLLTEAEATPSIQTIRGVGYRLFVDGVSARGRGRPFGRQNTVKFASAAA